MSSERAKLRRDATLITGCRPIESFQHSLDLEGTYDVIGGSMLKCLDDGVPAGVCRTHDGLHVRIEMAKQVETSTDFRVARRSLTKQQ